MAKAEESSPADSGNGNGYTLDSVRNALVRQEDTIVFALIERAKFPFNSQTYVQNYASIPGVCDGSLVDFVVKSTEAIQAKRVTVHHDSRALSLYICTFAMCLIFNEQDYSAVQRDVERLPHLVKFLHMGIWGLYRIMQPQAGRYKNPEENPFFPENLPPLFVPSYPFTQILHPGAALININKSIWKTYLDELLPLFVASGDDGNYAQTAATDLALLQAISRRIHYGKFVAEVKFRESPQEYEPLIRAQDREALMKLLTFESVEEMVIKRVEKKAKVFGQEVSLNRDDNEGKYKVDPSVVSLLYKKWVIPLTKLVEVEYLLRRLD